MNTDQMKNSQSGIWSAAARGTIRAALFAALASPPALADSRADAKRHFREGMSLIAAGQVERGIAELKQAYAIKPHPDVLYDIAKAYVEMGNIPEALSYFRQYVATDPVDKEQVLSVMQRLQAAIGPGASAPASPQPQLQSADVQKLIAQLQALVNQQQALTPNAGAGTKQGSAGKKSEPQKAAHPEDDMFEAETISARSRATAREIAAELSSAHDADDGERGRRPRLRAGARRGGHHLLLEDVVGVGVVSGGELGGDLAGGGPGPGGDGLRLEHVVLRVGCLLRLGFLPRRSLLRPGPRIGRQGLLLVDQRLELCDQLLHVRALQLRLRRGGRGGSRPDRRLEALHHADHLILVDRVRRDVLAEVAQSLGDVAEVHVRLGDVVEHVRMRLDRVGLLEIRDPSLALARSWC